MIRPALTNYVASRPAFEKYTDELFDLISKDKLKIKVHEIYPLADIQRAHGDIQGRKTTGKLLLKP
jgi:NADPH2:quinone reductase